MWWLDHWNDPVDPWRSDTIVFTLAPTRRGEMVVAKRWEQGLGQRCAIRVRVGFIDARGASLVEYALLIGLIALVVIAGAILLGDSLVTKFSDFGSEVENTP